MMISSLLDTDLYKFTMMQVVLHQFPATMVEYQFKCRTPGVSFKKHIGLIQSALDAYCSLRFSRDELNYLSTLPFIKSDFIEFLRIFQPCADFVNLSDETLIIRGPWLHTILFEVPLLAIFSEIVSKQVYPDHPLTLGRQQLQSKVNRVKKILVDYPSFCFSDFGTRRRYSKTWHEEVVVRLAESLPGTFSGTSNLYLAKKFGLKPLGTMAHEYIQACQALGPRLLYSQQFAFESWAKEYRGDLGIALSDTYGLEAFLHDFDLYFCKLFDGARHDSGDPLFWGDRIIQHYQAMGVDPREKQLVFSNRLDFEKAMTIQAYFQDRVKVFFGIGTYLTHDVGIPALDMVIKMVECNGQPVAKISDDPAKTMCRDLSYLNYLKDVFKLH